MYIHPITVQVRNYAIPISRDNNTQYVMAIDPDTDKHYVLAPQPSLRATPTLSEPKQVQPAMSPHTFTAE